MKLIMLKIKCDTLGLYLSIHLNVLLESKVQVIELWPFGIDIIPVGTFSYFNLNEMFERTKSGCKLQAFGHR